MRRNETMDKSKMTEYVKVNFPLTAEKEDFIRKMVEARGGED